MKKFNPNQKLEKIVLVRQLDFKQDQNYNENQRKQIQCILDGQAQISYSQFQISLRKLFRIDALALNLKNLPIQDDYESISKEFKEQINQMMQNQRHNITQKGFNWCYQITSSKEYGDFLLQIKCIYDICLKICNQNYQCSILLHQNFNNLTLMHVASIVHGMLCQECEAGKIIDFPRTMYFNLTGKEQQENLDFWAHFNAYYINFLQLFTLSFDTQDPQVDRKCIETRLIQLSLKSVGKGQFIIPLQFNNERIVDKYQMKIIFDFLIRKKIIDFRPNLIFVDILISNNLIELEALERLIRKFAKYSKVIVHLRYDPNENNPKIEDFLSTLNVTLNGLQGLKKIHTQTFMEQSEYVQRDGWLKNMYHYFQDKTDKNTAHLFMGERQIQKIKFKQQESLLQNSNLQRRLFMLDSDKNLTLMQIKEEFDKAIVSYEFKKLVLQDFRFSTAIIFEFDNQLKLMNRQVIENVPKQSSVIILKENIIFAYSFEVKQNQAYVDDQIIIYRISDKKFIICLRDQELMDVVFKKPKKYAKKMATQEILDKIITRRRGQQVCYNSFCKVADCITFMLVGGETWNSFQIMNVIECVIINEQAQKFFSLIVDNSKISLQSSIRPFPDMLILESTNEKRQIYLSFNGNLLLKYQYYYTMLNPNNSKIAQLLILQSNKFELLNIDVEKKGFRLEDFKSEDFNQQLIEESEYMIQWKVICTRFANIKKAKYLPQNFQQLFSGPSVPQFISVEFTITLQSQQVEIIENKNQNQVFHDEWRVIIECNPIQFLQEKVEKQNK